MSKITIPKKMSNSGSIYDIASDNYAIVIDMGKKYQYAVLLPAYYGSASSRHTRADLAIKKYNELSGLDYQGVTILNRAGDIMEIDFDDNLHILTN